MDSIAHVKVPLTHETTRGAVQPIQTCGPRTPTIAWQAVSLWPAADGAESARRPEIRHADEAQCRAARLQLKSAKWPSDSPNHGRNRPEGRPPSRAAIRQLAAARRREAGLKASACRCRPQLGAPPRASEAGYIVKVHRAGGGRLLEARRLGARRPSVGLLPQLGRCRGESMTLRPNSPSRHHHARLGDISGSRSLFLERRGAAGGPTDRHWCGVGISALTLAATSEECPSDSLSVATLLRVTNLQGPGGNSVSMQHLGTRLIWKRDGCVPEHLMLGSLTRGC